MRLVPLGFKDYTNTNARKAGDLGPKKVCRSSLKPISVICLHSLKPIDTVSTTTEPQEQPEQQTTTYPLIHPRLSEVILRMG